MSSWIYIWFATSTSDITVMIIIIIIIVQWKAYKVVVSISISASFSFLLLLICYVRSFTKENRQARKSNRVVEDDKIILIDFHCRCVVVVALITLFILMVFSSICLSRRLGSSKCKHVSKSAVSCRTKTTRNNQKMINIVIKLMPIVKRIFLFFLFDDHVISSSRNLLRTPWSVIHWCMRSRQSRKRKPL